jgi:small multidrug resistance family-3 protein
MPGDKIVRSIFMFLVAGLCEIGGGWARLAVVKKRTWCNMGACWRIGYNSLSRYPYVSTRSFWQGLRYGRWLFHRLFSLSGWVVDGNTPNRFDVIGAAVSVAGVCIMYWTR